MKRLILLTIALLSLSSFATKVMGTDFLIKSYFPQIAESLKKKPDHKSIDFAMIKAGDDQWTTEKVIAFFESLKGKEVVLKPQKPNSKIVEMEKPFKATFTFEERKAVYSATLPQDVIARLPKTRSVLISIIVEEE